MDELYGDGHLDDDGFFRMNWSPYLPPTCRKCGKRGLEWVDIGTAWRLFDGKKPHVCDVTDDFDTIREK